MSQPIFSYKEETKVKKNVKITKKNTFEASKEYHGKLNVIWKWEYRHPSELKDRHIMR